MTNTTTEATAAAIKDAVKLAAHWATQERSARDNAASTAEALTTLPTDHYRHHHLTTQVGALTRKADSLAQDVQEARARLTSLTTVTVALPGGFCDWFEETGVATGTDNADPECAAAHAAWQTATRRNYGRNGYAVTVSTTSPAVLNLLEEYTGYCLEANADEPRANEVKGAKEAARRIQAARTELLALLALVKKAEEEVAAYQARQAAEKAAYSAQLAQMNAPAPQEQQEAQEAPSAPERPMVVDTDPAPSLTSWERETLANADQAPTTVREPSADLNTAQGDDPQGPQEADENRVVLFSDHRRCEHRKSIAADHALTCPVYDEGATNDQCACHYSDARCEAQQATATPVELEWTRTVKGHHNGVIRIQGTTYEITHVTHARIERGALGSHLAHQRTPEGHMGPSIARAWDLPTLLAAVATHAGIRGALVVTEHNRRSLTRR